MTRKEAIEVYNGLINTKIKEAFEFFAPALRISEDDRIREEFEENVNPKERIDWEYYRIDIARQILCEMIHGGYGPGREQHQAELAVKYTDCLINELKK